MAKLARLDLSESEMLSLQGELNSLLGHFSDIQSVDTSGMPAKSHAVALHNVWSDDLPGPTLPRERALVNAAASKAGLFIVPSIIEE